METKKKVARKPKIAEFQISKDHVLQFHWQEQNYAIPLKKSTPDEILKLRLTRQSGFILRNKNGELYCAPIPSYTLISKTCELTNHLCRDCVKCCECQKFLDGSLDTYIYDDKKFEIVTKQSKRLENYPFITYGYQVFNALENNIFTVCECEKFSNYRPRKTMTFEELKNATQMFFDFLYDYEHDD